ncbi:MAG: hypothetical protein JOY80_06355 [Candidatus Dormibacteraeota bacterium]|nr:hypothetical protein [Candidatus Dormibacteraeota bacterium]
MKHHTLRWYAWVGPVVGIATVLAGLALLVVRHDATQGYSFLTIGAVIFGTSGIGLRRRGASRPIC